MKSKAGTKIKMNTAIDQTSRPKKIQQKQKQTIVFNIKDISPKHSTPTKNQTKFNLKRRSNLKFKIQSKKNLSQPIRPNKNQLFKKG